MSAFTVPPFHSSITPPPPPHLPLLVSVSKQPAVIGNTETLHFVFYSHLSLPWPTISFCLHIPQFSSFLSNISSIWSSTSNISSATWSSLLFCPLVFTLLHIRICFFRFLLGLPYLSSRQPSFSFLWASPYCLFFLFFAITSGLFSPHCHFFLKYAHGPPVFVCVSEVEREGEKDLGN